MRKTSVLVALVAMMGFGALCFGAEGQGSPESANVPSMNNQNDAGKVVSQKAKKKKKKKKKKSAAQPDAGAPAGGDNMGGGTPSQ